MIRLYRYIPVSHEPAGGRPPPFATAGGPPWRFSRWRRPAASRIRSAGLEHEAVLLGGTAAPPTADDLANDPLGCPQVLHSINLPRHNPGQSTKNPRDRAAAPGKSLGLAQRLRDLVCSRNLSSLRSGTLDPHRSC